MSAAVCPGVEAPAAPVVILDVVVSGLPADLAVVDCLARLQLAARRAGCTVRLLDPDPELLELLDLAGLTEVLLAG